MAAVRKFVRHHRIQYKVGWVTPEALRTLMNDSRYAIVPQTFVISRAGRIVSQFQGFDPQKTPAQWREAIEEALTEAVVFRDGAPAATFRLGGQ